MKKLFYTVFAAAGALMAACSGSTATDESTVEVAPYSVEAVFADADSLLGDTLEVRGVVAHLCAHGGKKAFLMGEDTTLVLRCESTEAMGGPFPADVVDDTITVRGVLCEMRIDSAMIGDSQEAHACEFRARIARRDSLEGKPYISQYYIESLSFTR